MKKVATIYNDFEDVLITISYDGEKIYGSYVTDGEIEVVEIDVEIIGDVSDTIKAMYGIGWNLKFL